MTPIRRTITFRADADLAAGLQRLQKEHGVSHSEVIRRALRAWLEAKGVLKAARPRAVTRKRA